MKSVIEVVYAQPSQQTVLAVECDLPASIEQVIQQSGILSLHPDIVLEDNKVGIHGHYQPLNHPVIVGDRVEIYRRLQMSPTEARLLRAESRKKQQNHR